MQYTKVINFWFEQIEPKQWWIKDLSFDARIKEQYLEVYTQVSRGELEHWRDHDEGRLAEIIVLDQFPRNMFRGEARSFSSDQMALDATKAAINVNTHTRLTQDKVNFLLMPIMHSESLDEHLHADELMQTYASEGTYQFELKHRAIIQKFGRYPHRNIILGRESTAEEVEFLQQPGSSF